MSEGFYHFYLVFSKRKSFVFYYFIVLDFTLSKLIVRLSNC